MPATIGYADKLTKRVSKEKLETVARAKDFLEYCREHRADREKFWKKNEQQYMGTLWRSNPDDPTADIVGVNFTFSTVETINPFITGGDTQFVVKPWSGDSDSTRAQMQTIFLNHLWESRSVSGQTKVRRAAWDSILYGDGYVSVLWDIKKQWAYDLDGEPVPGSDKEVVEFEIRKISPWDIWIDPMADSLETARWWIMRTIMPLEEFKEDARFYNTADAVADEGSLTAEEGRLYATNASIHGREEYVSVYDFYDSYRKRLITFTKHSELPHRWIKEVVSPLVQFANHPIPNSPYHMSDVEQISSLQDEMNKTRSQMITHRRRNVPKVLYRGDVLDDEGIDSLQSSVVYGAIRVEGDEDLDALVKVLETQPISSDLYNVSDLIRNDIFEITGVNEYLRGAVPDQSRTATEASIIEGGSNIKVRRKIQQVEDATRVIGQLILDIAREAYPATDFQEMSMYITGKDAERVLQATGDDVYNEDGEALDAVLVPNPGMFKGKYEVFVETGTTELRNPMVRENKTKELFLIMLNAYPLLAQAGIPLNLKRVLETFLEASGFTDIDGFFQNPVGEDPQVQQMLNQLNAGEEEEPMEQPPGAAGLFQQPGMPNSFGANPPAVPPSPENSGMVPPSLL